MRNIGAFELIDYGIKHSQYFQSCGIAYTEFTHITTGIGDNPAEAIDDCLEQIAQCGFDTEGMGVRIMENEGWEGWEALPLTPNAYEQYGSDSQLHYHVSIRWNEITEAKARQLVCSRCWACACALCWLAQGEKCPTCGSKLRRNEECNRPPTDHFTKRETP